MAFSHVNGVKRCENLFRGTNGPARSWPGLTFAALIPKPCSDQAGSRGGRLGPTVYGYRRPMVRDDRWDRVKAFSDGRGKLAWPRGLWSTLHRGRYAAMKRSLNEAEFALRSHEKFNKRKEKKKRIRETRSPKIVHQKCFYLYTAEKSPRHSSATGFAVFSNFLRAEREISTVSFLNWRKLRSGYTWTGIKKVGIDGVSQLDGRDFQFVKVRQLLILDLPRGHRSGIPQFATIWIRPTEQRNARLSCLNSPRV